MCTPPFGLRGQVLGGILNKHVATGTHGFMLRFDRQLVKHRVQSVAYLHHVGA